ncbi:hypothetical protein cypCar_00035354 [Cyprinus carpio]|nr:hypothetical protein cypCar_00035354 [Cyprinus carpio]
MWREAGANNSSVHKDPQDHNLTQIVSPVSSWLRSNSDRNGSAASSPPPLAETPVNRESGIIPVDDVCLSLFMF